MISYSLEHDSRTIETSKNLTSGGSEIHCEKNEPIISNKGSLANEIPEVSCQEPVEEEIVRIDSLVDGNLNHSSSKDTTIVSEEHGERNFGIGNLVSDETYNNAAAVDDQLIDNIPLKHGEATILQPDSLDNERNDTPVKTPLDLGTESIVDLDHHHQNSSVLCSDEIPSGTKPCSTSNGGCSALENGCKRDNSQLDTNDLEVNVHSSQSRSGHSTNSALICSVQCCTGCLNVLYNMSKNILRNELESDQNDWTIEDVHDIVVALSVDLLAAVRRAFLDEKNGTLFDDRQMGGNGRFKSLDSRTCDCKSSKDMVFKGVECICHLSEKVSPSHSEMGIDPNFIFRDGVLVSVDPEKNVLFHCKVETLCLCSLTELIVMAKKPLN